MPLKELLEFRARIVVMRPGMRHRHQVGLREPRDSKRRAQVDRGAVAGTDHDGRVTPLRIMTDDPFGQTFGVSLVKFAGRDGFASSAPWINTTGRATGRGSRVTA